MNLQALHDTLAVMPADALVEFEGGPGVAGLDSWRGSYDELTLTHASTEWRKPVTAGELHQQAEDALNGKTFEGYKGGTYTMRPTTPVWGDDYGECSMRGASGLSLVDGKVIVATVDLSDYR